MEVREHEEASRLALGPSGERVERLGDVGSAEGFRVETVWCKQ